MKKYRITDHLFVACLTVMVVIPLSGAQLNVKSHRVPAKTTTENDQISFDVNRIFSYVQNNGHLVSNQGSLPGMYWPGLASRKTINYASGLWMAGKINGTPVTACAEYDLGEWAAGKALQNGEPADMNDPRYKIHKINKSDAGNPQGNPDWMNWPVEDGAPWIDANSNSIYEPMNGDRPDILGDQTLWFVMNDLSIPKHANLFSTQPMGLECRVTIWGYNRSDEMGDMMFAKFQLFNKKSDTIDSCYLGIWADVDLGDSGDDFVGCDTTLGLGYTYNDGPDGVYGNACPSLGYDFLQGAQVPSPGDQAKAFGLTIADQKNLGMTAFVKLIRTDDNFTDPTKPEQCWNYMAGLHADGRPFVNPINGQPETPVLYGSGDPVNGTGWLDALDTRSGDRRQLQSCGPFTMAPGDSQEIVIAMIVGQGQDALSSVSMLKYADRKAQAAYDNGFLQAEPPPRPDVQARGLDGRILLSWDAVADRYASMGYAFQGYNVYQTETESQGVGASKRVANYDIEDGVTNIRDETFVPALNEMVECTVQPGSDGGIRHYITFNTDPLRDGTPLINNRPYYFVVTSYAYNPLGIPKVLESEKKVVTVYPQQVVGKRIHDAIDVGNDSTLVVSHSGPSLGAVTVKIIDPLAITGHDYKVAFDKAESGVAWKLIDATLDSALISHQSYQGTDDRNPVADGLMVKVSDAPPGLLACVETANPAFASLPEDQMDDTGRPFGGKDVWGVQSCADDANQAGRFMMSVQGWGFEGDLSQAHDYEMRWTAEGSWACFAFTTGTWIKVPFEIWDVGFNTPDDSSDDVQMVAILWEVGGTPDVWDIPNGGEVDGIRGLPCSDNLTFFHVDGTPGGYPDLKAACDAGDFMSANGMWGLNFFSYPFSGIVVAREDGRSGDPAQGTVVRFITKKPNGPADTFSFSTSGYKPSEGLEIDKEDVSRINVFPNPYFGANVEETRTLQHFVRFTHLPKSASIRIFSLAGELVRSIQHQNETQYEEWDLLNEHRIPVASGMYIIHVDCGRLGQKVLKLAIITPEERLRQF